MKEYIQPEVELVKFTSEDVTTSIGGSDGGSAVSNIFGPGDIVGGNGNGN